MTNSTKYSCVLSELIFPDMRIDAVSVVGGRVTASGKDYRGADLEVEFQDAEIVQVSAELELEVSVGRVYLEASHRWIMEMFDWDDVMILEVRFSAARYRCGGGKWYSDPEYCDSPKSLS